MKFQIERVEVFDVAMPLVGTFTSAGVSKNATKCVVVRLTASDGTIGISSIDPSSVAKSPNTGPELAAAIRSRITPAIVGQDPTNLNRLVGLLDTLTPTQPGAGAAVELACVELTCRKLGVPIYTYLGGAVETSVLFNGWIGELPPEEAATEAKRWQKAGFRSAKIKVGSGVEADRDRVAAVREAVGNAMKLRIDANMQYDADTSLNDKPVSVDTKTATSMPCAPLATMRVPSADTAKSVQDRPCNANSGAGRPTSSIGFVRTGTAGRKSSAAPPAHRGPPATPPARSRRTCPPGRPRGPSDR